MKKMLNLSNHTLTQEQVKEINDMGYEIVELTPEDKKIWGQLNPTNYVEETCRIVEDDETRYKVEGYHIAVFPPAVVVANSIANGLGLPSYYAYSERQSVEEKQSDGSIKKTNVFKHKGFFLYD